MPITDELDDTLPPGPPRAEPVLPSDQELITAYCTVCGKVGCRSAASDQVFTMRYWCATCEPTEIREARNINVLIAVHNLLAAQRMLPAESLSVLSVLLHVVGAEAGENLDTLQEGLREAETRYKDLAPMLQVVG